MIDMVRWSKLPPSRHSGIQLSLPAAETANWQYCIPPSTGLLRPPPPQASSGKMRWVAQKLDTLQVQRAIRPRSRQRRRRRRRRRQSCTSSRISLRQSSQTARSPRAARNCPAEPLQLPRWFTSAGSRLHPGASCGDAEPTLASICRRGGEANISLLHHKVDAAERPKDARTHDSQSIGSGVSAEGVETRCWWCAVAEGRQGVSLFGIWWRRGTAPKRRLGRARNLDDTTNCLSGLLRSSRKGGKTSSKRRKGSSSFIRGLGSGTGGERRVITILKEVEEHRVGRGSISFVSTVSEEKG